MIFPKIGKVLICGNAQNVTKVKDNNHISTDFRDEEDTVLLTVESRDKFHNMKTISLDKRTNSKQINLSEDISLRWEALKQSNCSTIQKSYSNSSNKTAATSFSRSSLGSFLSSSSSGRELHDRAANYLRIGRLDEALVLFKKILRDRRRNHGSIHPSIGSALHNISLVYIKKHRYVEALKFCQEAVQVRKAIIERMQDTESNYENRNVDVSSSLLKLGSCHLALKEFDEGLKAFRECLFIRRKFLGQYDASVVQILTHIGQLFYSTGELMAAANAFEEALEVQRNVVKMKHKEFSRNVSGANNLNTNSKNKKIEAEILANIGTIQSKRKLYSRAVIALEEAVLIRSNELESGNQILLNTMDNLAYAYSKNKKNTFALKVYKKMLRSQVKTLGPFHMDCAKTLSKMSIMHEKLENFPDAYECSNEARSLQLKHLSPSHPDMITTEKNLARLEKKLQRHSCDNWL